MKTFYHLLVSAMVVTTKNLFVWFALTYWVYLETHSVVSTGLVGGSFMILSAFSGFWFGSLVDHHKKKPLLIASNLATLISFAIAFALYLVVPHEIFTNFNYVYIWFFAFILLVGVIAGNIMGIAIPTLVTTLVPEDKRDRANGMFGTSVGIAFAITSVASGIVLGRFGMMWVLVVALILSIAALIHLFFLPLIETKIIHIHPESGEEMKGPQKIDIKGTIRVVKSIPGLFGLIFFTTFNNFVGGVFMALMDAYGLSLVTVEQWGTLWGFLSFGFIFGGLYIAKFGLGKKPLKTLFLVNIVVWSICMVFTLQPSIILLAAGSLIYMSLVPFIEATEQTVIQKVVPHDRQGRVFGFAHSVEQSASPLTAFLIGPITQFIFIPFMTTGAGVDLIGGWFGVGAGRGIALVITGAGFIGLVVTLLAMRSRSYHLLSKKYAE